MQNIKKPSRITSDHCFNSKEKQELENIKLQPKNQTFKTLKQKLYQNYK